MGFKPLTSRSLPRSTAHSLSGLYSHSAAFEILKQALLRRERNRDHSKLMNESVKKSPGKSKNVLEEKRKNYQEKFALRTNTFTIIATQEYFSLAFYKISFHVGGLTGFKIQCWKAIREQLPDLKMFGHEVLSKICI